MISDFISDLMLSFQDRRLFNEMMGLIVDKTEVGGCWAFRRIVWLIKWAVISFSAAFLLLIILIASLTTGCFPPWLNLILIILCGITAFATIILLAPMVMPAWFAIDVATDVFPSLKEKLKKYPGAVASAAFWIIFSLFSYWKLQAVFSPSAAAGLFIVMLMIGLGSATGWVLLPPKKLKIIITSQLLLCFFFVLTSVIFPKLLPAINRWMRHNESTAAERLDDGISQLVKIDPENPPAMFNTDGSPRFSFTQNRDGVFRVFYADVEYDPDTRQRTSLVKTTAKRDEIIAQIKNVRDAHEHFVAAQAVERDRQISADAERRFREKYLNESVLSSNKSGNAVLFAVKSDPADSETDILADNLSGFLAKTKKIPVAGAFKPAFFKDGLFDAVWNNDSSVLARLELFQGTSRHILLVKANFTSAEKNGFEELVSVHGMLSIIVIDRDGRKGSLTCASSGAGGDAEMAKVNCVKRLIEAIDAGAIFGK